MVVMGVGSVVPTAQFHRFIPVSVGNTLNAQQGCPERHVQVLHMQLRCRNGPYFFFGPHHANIELGLEQGVHGALVIGQLLSGQAFERRCG